MSCFDERKTYLFLGFNLENWDFRLLLDCFKLSKENTSLSPQLGNYMLQPETQSFFEDRYQFVFVEQEINQFAEEVQKRFSEQHQSQETKPAAEKRTRRVVLLYQQNEADQACFQKLSAQLNPWIQDKSLSLWHPGAALHGDVEQQMLENIQSADLVMPILSADFLADPAQQTLIEQSL